ncbi:Phosphomevalonate kinase, peroxisomal [Camellia lanceoleosa]|uniref:Phosphomevalonate kinase, peroxisomal n=1 Tax=Camellia lanceoleosa TaxID=1840588 RepID=A0ACC0HBV5_9ERIC|nr:Phosphomevalonate kinase, peroxisomal [Camellia lanceoleosa]
MTSIHIGIRWGLSCEIGKGKVGSGFEVSSAVYSSQRYVRFSPEVLSSAQDVVKGKALEEVIGDVLNGK